MMLILIGMQLACHINDCHLGHDNFMLILSVTGIVVALLGKETGAGDFLVQDVLQAGLPPQIEFPLKSSTSSLSFTCYNPLTHTHGIIMGFFCPDLSHKW